MTTTTTVTPLRQTIHELVRLRDPMGVLSIYADAGLERGRRHRPRAGDIALRKGLEEIRAGLEREGWHARVQALEARLGELGPALDDLVDPSRPGRGRALIVPLSGGPAHEVTADRSLGEGVVLATSAHAAPLLRALLDEESAGVVSVTREGVRALEIRHGRAEEVLRLDFAIPSDDWRPMVGPAAANPAFARSSESQRDLFARRMEEHRGRRLAEIGERLWAEAHRRGWRRLATAGEPKHLEALAATRPADGPELVALGRHLPETLTPAQIGDAASDALDRARVASDRALAERIRDAALTPSGRAVVGLDDTLTVLEEGRASRLLVDVDRRPAGEAAPDGRLVTAGEVPPTGGPAQLAAEPHLLERMIERAADTGAVLVPLEGPAAEPLASHDGVAAELRW